MWIYWRSPGLSIPLALIPDIVKLGRRGVSGKIACDALYMCKVHTIRPCELAPTYRDFLDPKGMSDVVIYATKLCPYCQMAKALLDRKGVAYSEIDVTWQPSIRAEMTEKAGGRRTVPQIWIGDTHVGGCDELFELERKNLLDDMLEA